MSSSNNVCFMTGLSFKKTNIIPKDIDMGPVVHYPYEKVLAPAYQILEDGAVRFCLYYPNAEKVSVSTFTNTFDLTKKGDYWYAECKLGTGFIVIMVNVDGNDVICPTLPIGFGGNVPINFIEVLEKNTVICPIECRHGTVVMDYMQSQVTGTLERIYVYIPPGYYEKPDKKFPVLYLQHGHGENETTWVNQGKMNFIYDNLIAQGKAVPAIVVMCNGMPVVELEEELYVGVTEVFEEMLIREVIPYIEQKYRIVGDKAHRAMAGLSMGSMQTSLITLKHQELFDYAGIFSGFVKDILTGYTEHIKPEYIETYSENLKFIYRAIGSDDVYMDAFLEDDLLLEKYHVKCERVIYQGKHEWKVWQHCLYDFAQKIFVSSVEDVMRVRTGESGVDALAYSEKK